VALSQLVAQIGLELGWGQLIFSQTLLVKLLVKLAGNGVEEGSGLADLLADQLVSG
jgi:hypothetical protein